jgi:hypothetical protein
MLDVKVKGLFDVLNVCVGINGNDLETTMQIEVFDLSKEDQDKMTKIITKHLEKMSAGDLLRKLTKA